MTCTIHNLDVKQEKFLRSVIERHDCNVTENADGTITFNFLIGGRYNISSYGSYIIITSKHLGEESTVTIRRDRYSFIQLS